MKVASCDSNELARLYEQAGLVTVFDLVSALITGCDGKTYQVTGEKEDKSLFVAVAYCDSGDGRTDLVVAGFATNTMEIEQISPLLIDFLVHILQDNPDQEFDLVSFPCLAQQNDPQMRPYLDQNVIGFRPVISAVALPEFSGRTRVRLAHDAESFRVKNSH